MGYGDFLEILDVRDECVGSRTGVERDTAPIFEQFCRRRRNRGTFSRGVWLNARENESSARNCAALPADRPAIRAFKQAAVFQSAQVLTDGHGADIHELAQGFDGDPPVLFELFQNNAASFFNKHRVRHVGTTFLSADSDKQTENGVKRNQFTFDCSQSYAKAKIRKWKIEREIGKIL